MGLQCFVCGVPRFQSNDFFGVFSSLVRGVPTSSPGTGRDLLLLVFFTIGELKRGALHMLECFLKNVVLKELIRLASLDELGPLLCCIDRRAFRGFSSRQLNVS